MKNKERREKEARVRRYLAENLSPVEIAEKEGVSRQAMWEFLARRELLPGEAVHHHAAKVQRRDERRRQRRAYA